MRTDLVPIPRPQRIPRVAFWRRMVAFGIDFFGAWLLSSLASGSVVFQSLLFLMAWLLLRVAAVIKNHGQSLGRWTMDLKVVDADLGRLPGLQPLLKRELLIGILTLPVMLTVGKFFVQSNAAVLVFIVPLILDASVAMVDPNTRQTYHDRLARTFVGQTYRGFSLDLKVKHWVGKISRIVKK